MPSLAALTGLAKQSYRAGEDREEGERKKGRRGKKKEKRGKKKEKRGKKKEKREKKGKLKEGNHRACVEFLEVTASYSGGSYLPSTAKIQKKPMNKAFMSVALCNNPIQSLQFRHFGESFKLPKM